MTGMQQPIAPTTKEIVPLMYSAILLDSSVTDCAAYNISLDCALIGAGLCASSFEV